MDKKTEDEMERRLRETFDKRVPEGWFDWRGLQTNGSFFEQSSAPSSPFNCLFVDETQKQNCVEHLCTPRAAREKNESSHTNGNKQAAESGAAQSESPKANKSDDEDVEGAEEEDDEEADESESEDSDDNSDGLQADFRQKVLNNRRHRQLQLLRQATTERSASEASAPASPNAQP